MGVSCAHPLLWLLLPAAWGLAWYLRRPWLEQARQAGKDSLNRERRRLGVRFLVLALLVAALAGPRLVSVVKEQAVAFVLDASDSVGPALGRAEEWVRQALNSKQPGDLAAAVAFGVRPLVEEPPATDPTFRRVQTDPGTPPSDTGAALSLAGSLLPPEARRRVVLLSDGRDTGGGALAAARRLRQEGVRVDVVPVGNPPGPDVRLENVVLPPQAFTGEKTVLQVQVASDRPSSAELILERDGRLLGSYRVDLQAGLNRLSFPVEVGAAGLHRYQVRLQAPADRDGVSFNNSGGTVQRVEGPPRVLLVSQKAGEAAPLVRALQAAGKVQVETVTPDGVPPEPSGWAGYKTVFLVNVTAFELGQRAMEQIEAYVRDAGGGLVMTGGPDAFGPGGYAGTPLERALPVEMHISGRGEQPSLGLMLVVDKSGSMEGYKMELAKEAAARAASILTERDRVGVIAFDSAPWTAVPLTPARDKEDIKRQIGSIYASGGTEIYPAVAAAYQALKDAPVQVKHVILLTDGMSASGGPYVKLSEEMRRAGITLTTVAVGPDADAAMLQALAELGRGRFYATADASNIPSIFTRETVMATRSFAVNERFFPRAVTGGPLLRGFSEVPPLDGYITVTPKTRAEVNLISHHGDPVLAAWHYGLGRSVAWTPDVAGRWSAAWSAGEAFPRLWGNVLAWLLGPTTGGQMQAEASLEEAPATGTSRQARLRIDDPGGWSEVKELQARITGPDGQVQVIALEPAGPGRYVATIPVPKTGAYIFSVSDGGGLVAQAGLVVPYPEEYRRTGIDLAYLEEIARAGGGEVLEQPEAAFAPNLPPVRASRDFSFPLLYLAGLLWLADIAQRRLALGREGRAELHRAWQAALEQALARLRSRLPASADTARAERSLETARRLQVRRLGQSLGTGDAGSNAGPALPAADRSPAGASAGGIKDFAPGTKQKSGAPQDTAAKLLVAKKRRQPG